MVNPTKTQGSIIASLSSLDSEDFDIYSISSSGKMAVSILIKIVAVDTIGNILGNTNRYGAAYYPEIRIEASPLSSGDSQWFPIFTERYKPSGSLSTPLTLSGVHNNGSSTLNFSTTVSSYFTRNEWILIKNSTTSSSEFARVKTVNTNSIDLYDPITSVQTGSIVARYSKEFLFNINLFSLDRLRMVVDTTKTNGLSSSSYNELYFIINAHMIAQDNI